MKKIWLTLVAVVCCAATLTAETVSPSAARQVAEQFFRAQGATLADDVAHSQRSGRVTALNDAPAYYIFNADAAQGFVVVSGDDCVGDNLVLGYAVQGNFCADDVPDNLQWWLDATANGIARLKGLGNRATSATLHADIAPMLTTKWDQFFPFNNFCPIVDGQLSITGCMATALAQVMHYHRWPQAATDILPAYPMSTGQIVEGLPSTTFDWDNMLDDYHNDATDAQNEAVATLMRYCGQTIQMEYGSDVSNGLFYDLDLLVNAFGYDPGVYFARFENYTVSGWDALIYNELHEGRPLVYIGFSTGGGHAFVIDGYEVMDGEGYYSVNWGWGGAANGFFKIDLLDPDASGSGGSTTKDGYNARQQALIGLKPRTDDSKFYRHLYAYGRNVSGDDGLLFDMANFTYKDASFNIAIVGRQNDGTPDYDDVCFNEVFEVEGFSSADFLNDNPLGVISLEFNESVCEELFSGLAPGHHNYMFVSKEDVEGATWEPVYGPNCYIEVVIGAEGQLEQTILHPNPLLWSSSDELQVEGLKQRGFFQSVSAVIHNASTDDYSGTVFFYVYPVDNGVLCDADGLSMTGLMIEGGGTSKLFSGIAVPSVGDHVLLMTSEIGNATGVSLADIEHVPYYLTHKFITIDELQFVCQDISYGVYADENEDPLYCINATVYNGTPLDYDAVILIDINKRDDSGDYVPVDTPNFLYTFVAVPSEAQADFYIELPQALTPGDYLVNLSIANDFYSVSPNDYFVFATMPLTLTDSDITGVESLQFTTRSDNQSDTWYDLIGRRLHKKPTTKGIYLKNGQKVLLK
jgi:hypothetical protein